MADEATAGTAATAEGTATTDTGAASVAAATNVLAGAKVAETKVEGAVAEGAKATEAKAGDEGSKADGSKAAEGGKDSKDGKAAEVDAPTEYTDFTMPEGVEVDQAALTEAKVLFAEGKLPQEVAQKYVDLYAKKITEMHQAQVSNWSKLQEKWVGEFKADKDIGGDRAEATVSAAAKAMDRFGTPGLRDALITTGAGNHPEVIRFVARIGNAISEDSHVVAGGASAGSKSAAEVFYPNQGKD